MECTTNEKQLKSDIYKKNMVLSEIERQLGAVFQWKEKLTDLKSFQGQKKYTASIKRYIEKIECLRAELNQMNEKVDRNIRELGKFSDSEVNAFCSRLDQELSGIEVGDGQERKGTKRKKIKNARTKLTGLKGRGKAQEKAREKAREKAQEKIEKARKKMDDDIEEIALATGKIIKLNQHLRKISIGAASTSGDNEEFHYTQELKRIAREKVIYG